MAATTKKEFGCDQCNMAMINGTPCHEIGCPNMGSRWDAEEGVWIKQRTCFECGCKVDADHPCCQDDDFDNDDDDTIEVVVLLR